ncbi:MAG: DUF4956 domain-containing protein [Angelakisella sp.]|nr:DUF4956 domain-containing protein [Angelakisella sp.]
MTDILLGSSISDTLTMGGTVTVIVSALALGLCISLVYLFTHRSESFSASFPISLIMLPAIIAMIILLVGSNVARAFSLAGAFSLIRFRSAPGDSKDIAYVFFSLGVGLACGMGFIGYALIFAVMMCVVIIALEQLHFGRKKAIPMRLKILLPEDMDYCGVFDDILKQYTAVNRLVKVKTEEYGAVFELTYELTLKNPRQSKAFLDELRCKNGNMRVMLAMNTVNEAAAF